jgi:hypothetical protein
MLTFSCPKCNAKFTVGEQFAGHRGKCRSCGAISVIPRPPLAAAGAGPVGQKHSTQTTIAPSPSRADAGSRLASKKRVVGLLSIPIVILICVLTYWFGLRDTEGRDHFAQGDKVTHKQADKDERAEEQQQRPAKQEKQYAEYLAKVQPLLDALIKLDSATEMGVNLGEYKNQVKELNFQQKRSDGLLSIQEKGYSSWVVMNRAFEFYLQAKALWEENARFSLDGKKMLDQASKRHDLNIDTSAWDPDKPGGVCAAKMEVSWRFASGLVRMAQQLTKDKEATRKQRCPSCDGKGVVSCPLCAGTGQCFGECEGTGHVRCAPCGGSGKDGSTKDGTCHRCKGKGQEVCAACSGTGKCQICNSGSFNCKVCGGKGEVFIERP